MTTPTNHRYSLSSVLTALTSCACLLASAPTHAAGGYSVAAKLAMYDALKETCRPLVPALFDEVKGRLITLTLDERSEATKARQSAEYFDVLNQTRKSMFDPKDRDHPAQIKECTEILTIYLPIPE